MSMYNCGGRATATTARQLTGQRSQGSCRETACPACSDLNCLCRPRFFAGQLLTEDELNRLEQYIVDKNRLHNRYLHGWGVVCGLEVVCHPCEDQVVVRAGYALSPCGDDIVVCNDVTVDICDLIQQCREAERRQRECSPYGYGGDEDSCRDVEEDWVLSICYDEVPSRPTGALRASGRSAGCAPAGCGGSSASTAGCQPQPAAACCRPVTGGTPAQCEPTLVCEGYRWQVLKVSKGGRSGSARGEASWTPVLPSYTATVAANLQKGGLSLAGLGGDLVERVQGCWMEAMDALPDPPARDNQDKAAWHRWCCDVKQAVLDFFSENPVYDCLADERLARFRCPAPDPQIPAEQYIEQVNEAVTSLSWLAGEYVTYCLCSALLPPCPEPVVCNCVPLATVKVRRAGCKIVKVCNVGMRQFAVTFPSLGYWLSPLQLGPTLRRLAAQLCCLPTEQSRPQVSEFRPEIASAVHATHRASYVRGTAARPRAMAVALDLGAARRVRPVSPATLMLDRLGAVDAEGNPLLSEEERTVPVHTLLANDLVLPLVERLSVPGVLAAVEAAAEEAAPADTVAELRARVEELADTVRRQEEEIAALRDRLGTGPQ